MLNKNSRMRTIKYKKNRRTFILKTECPQGPIDRNGDRARVGSVACHGCRHFIHDNEKVKKVICKYASSSS